MDETQASAKSSGFSQDFLSPPGQIKRDGRGCGRLFLQAISQSLQRLAVMMDME